MSPSDQFTLYSVVAKIVSAVARLAYAAAATNGSLRAAGSEDVATVLDEVLGQLDGLLMLGTHCSVVAERLAQTHRVVQRLQRNTQPDSNDPAALEEVREFIAGKRMPLRSAGISHYEQDEYGPDTDVNPSPGEGDR